MYVQSLTTASGSRLFGSVVEHLYSGGPGSNPSKAMGFFQPNLLCFVLCYGFHVVRWGLSSRLDLILCRNGLILRRNGFQVNVNDDFFEEGGVLWPITPTLCVACRCMSYL